MSELSFRILVAGVAGLVALGLIQLRFCYDVSLPDKPPPPEAAAQLSTEDVATVARANPEAYAEYIRSDSQAYRVEPPATPEQMAKVLPFQSDDRSHELDPRGATSSMDIAGLRISVGVQAISGSPQKMMVLTVTNLGDSPVAYQVVTRPSVDTKVCRTKPHLSHNAMALLPGASAQRSECLYIDGWKLTVERVETVELSELSYYYVSKVPPEAVGHEARVAAGHRPPSGTTCNVILPAAIRRARETGQIQWRDLIDFFARHRCESYRFPDSYRAFSGDGVLSLPVPAGP